MMLDVHLFPCLKENYGFLARDPVSGEVAAVDAPDAEAVLGALEHAGWGRLDRILNTHWHADHTAGNAALKAATGCEIVGPQEVSRVAPLDRVVADGDVVRIGGVELAVLATPGHTLGHIVYWSEAARTLFSGDTLFALGCGRLFEGTPAQMFDSLRRLAALPDETQVWCAHEYTAANARFTLSVDGRPETAAYAQSIFDRREQGLPTVPTTLGVEKAFNPFLRAAGAEDFARLRAAKDVF